MAVTGYDEAVSVYRDTESFSACNAVIGPMLGLPFEPTGDDITDQIQAHRAEMPFSDFMSTLDPNSTSNSSPRVDHSSVSRALPGQLPSSR